MPTLFVDLDKSLVKTDLLLESFLFVLSKNFFAPLICIKILLQNGIVELKNYLYRSSNINVANLPFNNNVLEYISAWKNKYQGQVILISASDDNFVQKVSNHLGIFDNAFGTTTENLKSVTKLNKIRELSEGSDFDYIGDSKDDLIIWSNCRNSIAVNPSKKISRKLSRNKTNFKEIHEKNNIFRTISKLIRVHQWVKNFLLFVPLFLSGIVSTESVLIIVHGFTVFSLLASAFYIFNDLLDIENDRNHPSKMHRPFANGSISIITGCMIFSALIFFSIVFSLNLPEKFQVLIFFYAVSTFLYSQFLKKIALVDILTLAYLYLLRIIGGGVIIEIPLSNWLLTFSVFFFLFLAAVKRWIEINKVNNTSLTGRGYSELDKSFLSKLSYFCGLISVLVICLYIDSEQASTIYTSPQLLWFIPIIFLYWITETLFNVERGEVNDDPVIYALKSKTSYVLVILCSIIIFFSVSM
tara:strand:- start:4134 stop:5543 length:1410 start_codon:yes stop_codon:yes gene_type:complete